MRNFTLAIALLAVFGWAGSAYAGQSTAQYSVSDAYGASGKTFTNGFTFTATTVTGTLSGTVSTPSSTFTPHQSNPPVSASLHMNPSGMVAAKGNVGVFGWTVFGTVSLHVQGSTQCHVATHTAQSDTVVPASCNLAGLVVRTKAHCTGHGAFSGARCSNGNLGTPGCWTGKSDRHTQTWTAKSVHCGAMRFSHTANSAHYFKSCQAKLTPPVGHTCGSGSGNHLASSDTGYHTFHIGAKLVSTP